MAKHSLYASRRAALAGLAAFALCAGPVPAGARAQPLPEPPCAVCAVFVMSPAESLLLPAALNDLEVLIRPGSPAGTRPADALGDGREIDGAMEAVRAAGGRPGLFLRDTGLQDLQAGTLAAASRIVIDLSGEASGHEGLVFRAKTLLSEVRGVAPTAALGVAASPVVVGDLLAHGVAPYLDFTVRTGDERRFPFVPAHDRARAVGAVEPGDGSGGAAGRWIVEIPADPMAARRLLGDVARAAPLLGDGLVAGGTAEVRCGGRPQQTYLDPVSLDTIAVVRDCDGRDIVVAPDRGGAERVALSSGTLVMRVPAGEGIFTEGVRVVGARTLSAREVVARHQAAAARQRRQVQTLVSSGAMTLTFEAPGFAAPLTITSETVTFTSPDQVDIEQRDIRVNGVAFRAGGVPRLPLLEPERVASPPLTIALTEVYRYSLAGQEEIAGVRCYVVAFDPLDRTASLFAGRAWIDADSFGLVRVAAVQTGLRGPIVSSEQIDDFRREGGPVWLLARSEVRQLYEGAGHRTPIHRVLTVRQHDINPADFAARRLAAYESPSVMLRDTVEGFRYLQRDRRTPEPRAAVVAGPATSVRTVALGVVVDPNITRPLPFAGISYVHFDLFGRGGQFAGFFGGTYGQLAMALPSLAGTRWQVGTKAFAIASPYNDRAFVEGREVYRANISQRPAHASVWLLRPLSDRLTVRAGYELDYTHFAPAESTAPSFQVPAAQAAHGVRLAVQGQWAGLDASAWWTGAMRAGWRAWGDMSDAAGEGLETYDRRHRDYHRYGLTLGRSWIASPRLVGRVEAAWMDGRDLDRFSRYTFGTFDNRLRGYPAALIRFDRGVVVRTATAWAAGSVLRVNGFADTAYVRDPGFGGRARHYTGAGFAAEVPGPLGTLIGLEWGYGFQGINTDGSRGTQVVRVSGYKMF